MQRMFRKIQTRFVGKIQIITLIFFTSLFLFFSLNDAKANQTFINDDFENGDLSRWDNYASTTGITLDTNVPCATSPNSPTCLKIRGSQSYVNYIYQSIPATSTPPNYLSFQFYNGLAPDSSGAVSLEFFLYNNLSTLKGFINIQKIDSTHYNLKYWHNGGSTGVTIFTDIETSTWHYLLVQIGSANNQIRFKLDSSSSWSAWQPMDNTGLNVTKIMFHNNSTYNTFYQYVDDVKFLDAEPDYFEITAPLNFSTVKDFTSWQLLYGVNSTTSNLILTVQYGTSPTEILYTDSESVSFQPYQVAYSLTKLHALSQGNWYAQLFVYDLNQDVVGYFPQVTFLVDQASGDIIDINGSTYTSTSTLSNLNTSCDSTSNLFTNSLCNLFYFLFIPSQSALNSFISLKDTMLIKAPFNYYQDTKDIINGIHLSSSTEPILNLNLNFGNGTTTSLAMMNYPATASLVGQSSMDLIYNLMRFTIWIYLLIYVYHRITGIMAPHQMSLF